MAATKTNFEKQALVVGTKQGKRVNKADMLTRQKGRKGRKGEKAER